MSGVLADVVAIDMYVEQCAVDHVCVAVAGADFSGKWNLEAVVDAQVTLRPRRAEMEMQAAHNRELLALEIRKDQRKERETELQQQVLMAQVEQQQLQLNLQRARGRLGLLKGGMARDEVDRAIPEKYH